MGTDADGEDVAASAFFTFHTSLAEGRFPRLTDRDSLWKLLVTICARKAATRTEHETAAKRDRRRTVSEHALHPAEHDGEPDRRGGAGFERVIGNEPTPQFALLVAEQLEESLDALGDPTLRRVALLRMEGYSVAEIAARIPCAKRTVARKTELIRKILSERAERTERGSHES